MPWVSLAEIVRNAEAEAWPQRKARQAGGATQRRRIAKPHAKAIVKAHSGLTAFFFDEPEEGTSSSHNPRD